MTKSFQRRMNILVLIALFSSFEVQAQIPGVTSTSGGLINPGGSEYFVGRIEGKPLITVNLLDGVRSPGVYHIPVQTNLAQLFSYAGGLSESADLDKITIRNGKNGATVSNKVDLDKIVDKNEAFPTLQDNDIVHISTSHDSLPRTALIIGIISAIATVILTTVTIHNTTSGK